MSLRKLLEILNQEPEMKVVDTKPCRDEWRSEFKALEEIGYDVKRRYDECEEILKTAKKRRDALWEIIEKEYGDLNMTYSFEKNIIEVKEEVDDDEKPKEKELPVA